jgi:hypothetical protein
MEAKMKKYVVLVLIMFLMMLTAPALQSALVQTSLVPEKAAWFIHLDVQKFARTQLKREWFDKVINDFKGEISEIENMAQIDFFKDVTNVTVIGMGEDDDTVVALSGKLNQDRLLFLLEEEENPRQMNYDKYVIYSWNDEYGVFVNDSLLMISESEVSLKGVLDTISGKMKDISSTVLASQLKALSPENFLTAVSVKLNDMIDDDDFPSAVLKNSRGAFFSVAEIGSKVRARLSLEADSPETAKNMGDVINGLKSLLAMQEKIDGEWDMVKSLKMNVQGSSITLETEALIEEIIRLIH